MGHIQRGREGGPNGQGGKTIKMDLGVLQLQGHCGWGLSLLQLQGRGTPSKPWLVGFMWLPRSKQGSQEPLFNP